MKKGMLICFGIIMAVLFIRSEDNVIIIRNARILTITKGTLEKGTILIRDDRIEKVGNDIKISSNAIRVIDAGGMVVTPGLIDSHSHLGLGPSGGITEDNEMSDPCTPQLRIIDSIHPEGMEPHKGSFKDAVSQGVTTIIARPGSGNVIGGQSAALKLWGKTLEDMLLVFPADMKMAMGRKGYYASKGTLPMTKMGTAYVVRKAMADAADYQASLSAYEKNKKNTSEMPPPKRDLKNEAMLKVLNREIPVHIHATAVDDIMTAVRLADEFNFFKLSLAHAEESYKVADELAKRGVAVVVGPQMVTFDDQGNLINIADFLVKHGVEVSIMTDADVVQQEFLRFQASIAVKYGMDPMEALKAITINPAKLIGMENRIGSIEAGKDADLVLFEGDPFDIQTGVNKVIINGRIVYDAAKNEHVPDSGDKE
ncbi:MAG: amidohydrolase family protein [Candidatus Aminicenantes bacterium]|nr:amidohydrolase family protein [Candidatus Aminicenantes bacterium]